MPSQTTRPAFQPGFEAQVDFMTELTRKSSDALRKLSELNLQFAAQLMQDAFDAGTRLLSCSNPLQMAATAANAAQPAVEHLRNYQQQLVALLSGSHIDMARESAFLPDTSRYTRDMASTMARANGAGADAQGNA